DDRLCVPAGVALQPQRRQHRRGADLLYRKTIGRVEDVERGHCRSACAPVGAVPQTARSTDASGVITTLVAAARGRRSSGNKRSRNRKTGNSIVFAISRPIANDPGTYQAAVS